MLTTALSNHCRQIGSKLWSLRNGLSQFGTNQFSTLNSEIDWKVAKEKFLAMDPDDKRLHYKNKGTVLTLDDIRTWSVYCEKMKLNQGYSGEKKWSVSHPVNSRVSVGRGDLTRLEIDAIVNSASTDLCGTRGKADRAVHAAAGPELLEECKTLHGCEVGKAKITGGYRLPAKYIIHTAGPKGEVPAKLSACYVSCLSLMKINRLKTVAFPCISTGTSGFPSEQAVHIALHTVRKFLQYNPDDIKRVIFCIYKDEDLEMYHKYMQMYFPMS